MIFTDQCQAMINAIKLVLPERAIAYAYGTFQKTLQYNYEAIMDILYLRAGSIKFFMGVRRIQFLLGRLDKRL